MAEDVWASVAGAFVDEAYPSVKGQVRTFLLHQQLMEHLPPPPASVLDVGGGAGHQSFPLAQAGYDVTVLDSSEAMLDRARERLADLPDEVQQRLRLVLGEAAAAETAVEGQRFGAVLCHGVLGYLPDPRPVIEQLCACTAPGGLVSVMTANAATMAVRPALERRWGDALAAFDSPAEIGVLGLPSRADTVEDLSSLLRDGGVEPVRWYGVWLFVDWLELAGVAVNPDNATEVHSAAAVELEASRRDPYRQLSRAFHLVGRKPDA